MKSDSDIEKEYLEHTKLMCSMINMYWQAKGKRANARPQEVVLNHRNDRRAVIWVIKSDLVDGLPKAA